MKISNSKKELARIISENGGWRNGGFAAQDGDGLVGGYGSKPEWNSLAEYWWREASGGWFMANKIKNHHQTVLSRAEYFHLYPAQDADGWIEWKGGECPVDDGDLVDVKFSDGDTLFGVNSGWDWGKDAYGCNIIAYRLHKHEKSPGGLCGEAKLAELFAACEALEAVLSSAGVEPEFCESVMRSIPETEAKPTIEQLATDYRNAKDCAERKQQEADDAKADADSKLKALELAGEAHGLLVTPITTKQEPELVITRFTGKFHSTKHGDRPSSLDAICDGCGKRFGTHVGFGCMA